MNVYVVMYGAVPDSVWMDEGDATDRRNECSGEELRFSDPDDEWLIYEVETEEPCAARLIAYRET